VSAATTGDCTTHNGDGAASAADEHPDHAPDDDCTSPSREVSAGPDAEPTSRSTALEHELADPAAYKKHAEIYARLRPLIDQMREMVQLTDEDLRRARDAKGPPLIFIDIVALLLLAGSPEDWKACPGCEGRGTNGNRKTCRKCSGRQYNMTLVAALQTVRREASSSV
jgi:hypothetical protein